MMTTEEFQKAVLLELSNIKAQQKENTDLIYALIHNTEVANAKIERVIIHNIL